MNIVEKNLLELVKALAENHVKFVICGGIACVMHGVERNTFDVDISVQMDSENLHKIQQIARKFDLYPRIPEPPENLLDESVRKNWIENKGALVYTFISGNSPLQMDIFLSYPKTYEELISKADKVIIDDLEIPISSIDDLIYAKNQIEPIRDKDKSDIAELKKLNESKN